MQTSGGCKKGAPRSLRSADAATAAAVRVARSSDRARALEPMVRKTPLRGAVQRDRLHATFCG
jgi:hypothetical protein